MPTTDISRWHCPVPPAIAFLLVMGSLGLWALPALSAPAPASSAAPAPTSGNVSRKEQIDPRWGVPEFPMSPIPLAKRTDRVGAIARGERLTATLSGTLIKQSAATTTWVLYPGACVERALGTWAPRSTPVADSLQPTAGFPNSSGYVTGQPNGDLNTIAYTRMDNSIDETLWHVASSSEPAAERPPIISGSRMLWCGKYDPNWVVKAGYPNLTSQILYIDTGAHAGPYYFLFEGNLACELTYDWVSFIGGGDNARDPLGNTRRYFDEIPSSGSGGPAGHSDLLVSFTGNLAGGNFPASGQDEIRSGEPVTGRYTIGPIDADHRAVYVFFRSDCLFSSEDGLWSQGHGMQLDNIDTSDNGAIYVDQAPAGGIDAYHGNVVIGTPASPIISCRVFPGAGELWQLASGADNPTQDVCSLQKASASDLFFEGGDPVTNSGVPRQNNAIVGCAMPVPPGTGSIIATWDVYANHPPRSGSSSGVSYRYYKDGAWSRWMGLGGTGSDQTWVHQAGELRADVDSVQIRYTLSCGRHLWPCDPSVTNPVFFDNFGLQFIPGAVPPVLPGFGWVSGPRTTFIDGTIHGTNCTATPCWPGLNGTGEGGVDDNWNDEDGGDPVIVQMFSNLGGPGVGINWRVGTWPSMPSPSEWLAIPPRTGYNPLYDVPRMIYRLFDPVTLTWSPWDSTEFVAASQINDYDGVGPAPPETVVVSNWYGTDWPPMDKVAAGASLPGGFTINGVGAYAGLSFLPRGTRMQYYFKAVDINGGVVYQFYPQWMTSDDGELPNLPCHASPGCVGPKPPSIYEWGVLPGVYPPGPAGSLLSGRTNTPVLVLEPQNWDFGYDPVREALRALGVRADRHPRLEFGGHQPNDFGRDGWPNQFEYPILDSLAAWYRIIIVPTHDKDGGGNGGIFEGTTFGYNLTALELRDWLETDTGIDGGDRCLFLSGTNALYSLLAEGRSSYTQLAQGALGVASAVSTWSGTGTTPYPNIDDRFSGPSAGPNLGTTGAYTYPVDGACPDPLLAAPPRFDALTRVGAADAQDVVQDAVLYPNGQVAGVTRMRELDDGLDRDREKTLAHGFSIQNIRDPAVPITNPGYYHSGIAGRARVLYKFLTSCRGPRTSAPSDTGKCWPCPTPGTTLNLMQSDWAHQSSGFQTGTYGPLYPMQAGLLATGVDPGEGSLEGAPRFNQIDGNYPNPFNPRTAIRFTSASAGGVEVRIFSIGGRLVRALRDTAKAGVNEVAWDGRGSDGERLASGVYFYKIVFPDGQSLRASNHLVIVK